jgi:hypothetical protein
MQKGEHPNPHPISVSSSSGGNNYGAVEFKLTHFLPEKYLATSGHLSRS